MICQVKPDSHVNVLHAWQTDVTAQFSLGSTIYRYAHPRRLIWAGPFP
jgi:hypothetical protein